MSFECTKECVKTEENTCCFMCSRREECTTRDDEFCKNKCAGLKIYEIKGKNLSDMNDYKPSLAIELMFLIDKIKSNHKKEIKEARELKSNNQFSFEVLNLVENYADKILDEISSAYSDLADKE